MSAASRILVFLLGFTLSLTAAPLAAQTPEDADFSALKRCFSDGSFDAFQGRSELFFENYPRTRYADELRVLIGRSLFYQGRFPRALAEFDIVAELANSDRQDDAVYWKGEVYFKAQDYAQALVNFQRIIDVFPSSRLGAYAYYSRGWAYFMSGYLEEAVGSFRQMGMRFPHDALAGESLFRTGEFVLLLGRAREALDELTKYLERFPLSARASETLLLCGEASARLKDHEGALGYFRRALAIGPSERWRDLANYGIARSSFESGDYAASLAAFSILYTDSGDISLVASALLGMAKSLGEQGKYEEALSRYDEALTNPVFRDSGDKVYYGKAEVEWKKGDIAAAKALLKEALEKFPRSDLKDELRYEHGKACAAEGDASEALMELADVSRTAGSVLLRWRALVGIGDIHMAAGHYQLAIEAFDKVLLASHEPLLAGYAQCRIADALLLTERYDEAALAFQSCLVNFPGSQVSERALFMLALAYFKKGDLGASSIEYSKFLRTYPSSGWKAAALLYLASSLYGQERYDDALAVLRAVSRERASGEVLALARYGAVWCYHRMHRERMALGECAYILKNYGETRVAGDVEYWCGEYFYGKGDLDSAERYFSGLLKKSPESPLADRAQFQLALVLEAEERFADAVNGFLNIGKGYPSSALAPEALMRAGDILMRLGRIDEASSCFEEAAVQCSDAARRGAAYRRLGALFRKKKGYGPALENLRKAAGSGNGELDAQVQYEIGECLEESGDLRGAREEFLKVPSLYPKSSFWSIRAELASAKISEKLGEPQEAVALYEALAAKNVEESKFAKERMGDLKKK